MLARFASNVFWLGRYVERAENLARLVDINSIYDRDDRGEQDWRRMLELFSDTGRFLAAHAEPDPASVTAFYVTDRGNPGSVCSAIRAARENAHTVRHLISNEMWLALNVLHHWAKGLTQRDLRPTNLSRLCGKIKQGCQRFEGTVEGTFYRGEPWHFYQVGKYLERADKTTRILDIGYSRLWFQCSDEGTDSVQWNLLLRAVVGYHAFRSLHPRVRDPVEIADFLLHEQDFPRSVLLCVTRAGSLLSTLGKRHGSMSGRRKVEEAGKRLVDLVQSGIGKSMTPNRLHRFLDTIQVEIGAFSHVIADAYFGQEKIADGPVAE